MAKINHNDTNRSGLQELLSKRKVLMQERAKDNRSEIIKDNLYNWIQSVPEYYRPAKYSLFTQTALIPISYYITNKQIPFKAIIHGQFVNVNNMFVYAIARYAVSQGILTPSQIRITTVQEGAEAVMGGFQKQAWRDDFFSSDVKMYIIMGASKQLSEMNITGVEKFLSMLSDHVVTHHKALYISYVDNNKESLLQQNGKWFPSFSKNRQLIATMLGKNVNQIFLTRQSVKGINKRTKKS